MKGDHMTLTPEDARNLMPENHVNAVLAILEDDIREAAENNHTSTRLRYSLRDYPENNSQIGEWLSKAPHLGYDNARDRTSNPVMMALGVLEERGFTVEFYYENRQFVDMGYRISWGERE